ncbi:MAG: Flagellar hook-associated protein 3 [Pseudomonadota bacterium]|jgi:flagellar hook-associated protein 3 FlgL
MRISTAYFYDHATTQVVQAQKRITESQSQLATGKKLINPSDEPDRALLIDRFRTSIARQEAMKGNLDTSDRRLSSQETAINSAVEVMFRFKELTVQASNDSLAPADREAISIEMTNLRAQLLELANSRDDLGHYIFSGSSATTEPFVSGSREVLKLNEDTGEWESAQLSSTLYQGDQTSTRLTNEQKGQLSFTYSGSEVFGRVIRNDDSTANEPQSVGFFDVIDDLITAVKDSKPEDIRRGLAESDQLFNTLDLSLVQLGADRNNIQQETSIIEGTVLNLRNTLSGIEDLDYSEAVSRMNREMLAMEAAMSSFSKSSQLSLFNFLR